MITKKIGVHTKDMTGLKFGDWAVLSFVGRKYRPSGRSGPAYWRVKCACGFERVLDGHTLRRGKSKRCIACKGKSHQIRPYEALYHVLVGQARSRSIAFNITYENFVELTKRKSCFYCGDQLKWVRHQVSKNGQAHNLDRVNNDLGYTLDNVVVCCRSCNRTKSNTLSCEEMLLIGAARSATRTGTPFRMYSTIPTLD